MRALMKLFGRSPFNALSRHMERVATCVHLLPKLFEAVQRQDMTAVAAVASEISQAEHDADLTKNDIRTSLKSHLFLPVSRVHLLEILAIQDSLADNAEDIAVLTTIRTLSLPAPLMPLFQDFLSKNLHCFEGIRWVMMEMDGLLESSFGGIEARKIRAAVDEVAYTEHQVDLIQRQLLHELFAHEEQLSYGHFILLHQLIREVSDLSNLSEKLGNRVLMTLELK